jgi:Putative DNA-binding domain
MISHLLLRAPDSWTLDDVNRLVLDQIPEGQRIEYKSALVLDTKSQKIEVSKDISGLANGQGGWIFFGIAEDESPEPLPTGLSPLPAIGLQTRLENILDSALDPIPDYEAVTIKAGEGSVILVRVAQASGRPVMIQGYEQHRYFVRSGTRTRPMNATEVATAHEAASNRAEGIRSRLAKVPIRPNIAEVKRMRLITSPELPWLPYASLVVAAITGTDELISRSKIGVASFAEDFDGYRDNRPVRSGRQWSINAFGLIDQVSDPPPPREEGVWAPAGVEVDPDDERLMKHRVAIYRIGVFEWAHRYAQDGIPSRSLADDIHNALLYAGRVFDRAGFANQLKIWLRIENAEEANLRLAHSLELQSRAPGTDILEYSTEAEVERLLRDPTSVTHSAMDAIWQGFGIERCLLFDNHGAWIE